MTQLVGWLTLSLGLAWLGRARPMRLVCLVVLLWIAVPAVAAHQLTGVADGRLAFHPATWLVLCVFAVQAVANSRALSAALARHSYAAITLLMFVLGAAVTSYWTQSGGLRLLFDQVIAPVLLFWIILVSVQGSIRPLLLLRNTVVLAVAGQCALAFAQSVVGYMIFYQSDYESQYWFNPLTFDRWMGTTDSPLVLSLAICVAAALTLSLRRSWLRFALMVIYLVGALITQSRTGIITLCFVVVFIIVRSRMAVWARTLYAVAIIVAGYLLLASSLVTGLSGRITNDLGSTNARLQAVRFFADQWTDIIFVGRGLTASYQIARSGGLETSLESSYLMYAVDTGLVLATAYFAVQLLLILQHFRKAALPGLGVAALIGFVLQQTFSGVASSNLVGTLIWVAIAMVVAESTARSGIDHDLPGGRHIRNRPGQRTSVSAASLSSRISSAE